MLTEIILRMPVGKSKAIRLFPATVYEAAKKYPAESVLDALKKIKEKR